MTERKLGHRLSRTRKNDAFSKIIPRLSSTGSMRQKAISLRVSSMGTIKAKKSEEGVEHGLGLTIQRPKPQARTLVNSPGLGFYQIGKVGSRQNLINEDLHVTEKS